jgi:DNA-cytosine methyltransferase
MKNGINVLSLFDGMSCGQIALERTGIKVNNYFASEIDKYAIQVTKANYPNTIQLGSIKDVKIKTLYLSDVMYYINSYEDNNIQSKFQEWEVLYWLDKDFTLAAKIGTQKPHERQEVSESSVIQRIEEVWFSNREMGSIRKCGDNTRSGSNGKENDIRTPQQLQCSEWWYDNDVYRRYKEENIRITERKTENRYSEKENFGNIKKEVFKGEESKDCLGENQESYVERGCKGKLFEGEGKNRFSRKVKEEKENGRTKENSFIDEIVRELCRWDETDTIAQDYWNILRLHKTEQVTVVEYAEGFHLFRGKIDILCGGSPCQGFSFAGKQLNFDDPRSKLFFEFVRLLEETKPTYWMLENVKMKKEYQDIISQYLGVEPIAINSSLVSAQNRPRLYWTNIPNVVEPTKIDIKLKDILQADVSKKYNIKDERVATLMKFLSKNYKVTDKVPTLTTELAHSTGKNFYPKTLVEMFDVLGYYRRLTPIEVERLQTVPDDYTSVVSNTERYKMLGNGWTVDVIAHIFKNL